MRFSAARGVLALVVFTSCAEGSGQDQVAASKPSSGALAPGVVARVGPIDISTQSIARIARAQALEPREATMVTVRDALFGLEAAARGLDREAETRAIIEGLLARELLRDLARESDGAGPVTDEELATVTQRHWFELDRPPGARTVHAVIEVKAGDAEQLDRATRLASRIAEAVQPAVELAKRTEPASDGGSGEGEVVTRFKELAQAVPSDGLSVVAEALPPVCADGRVLVAGGGSFDPAFASAAAVLSRGVLRAPVSSSFGVHVILGLEVLAERRVPAEERRRLLRDEVLANRATARRDALLGPLRTATSRAANVDALLALVPVGR